MNGRARALLEQAKALSDDERAEIADGLLATLPGDEIEAAWAIEIERRAREAHAGLSESRPVEEHLRELQARFEK
ncbi:MAG: addiction module protein [Polyangiaceae bacterium]|nr:addiction module protein [Polyangiaceae bacterium]